MKKKINCRHGLNEREEIQARRLKNKIIERDYEALQLLRTHVMEWFVSGREITFEEYLQEKNKVVSSAWTRVHEITNASIGDYYDT